MLNAHPDVAVPPESRFVVELFAGAREIDRWEFLRALDAHPRFATWDLPISAVTDELGEGDKVAYADAIAAAFTAYARVQGKTRWGDKTPRYVEDIALLASLWRDAHFIHLIRDGRDVALSYADVPFGPKTVGRAARLWAQRVRAGREAGSSLPEGRYLEIGYENLVEDAEGEIKKICDFLELDFDPGMLDYTERARDSVLPRASMYNPNVTRPPAKTRAWQESMRPSHVEMFEAVAGDLLTALGYERRYSAPAFAARLSGRLGALGLPIGRI